MLHIENVTAGYGEVTVLRGLSLSVPEGAFGGIVGANGAGKSTLLRAISGVIPVSAGRIEYLGTDLGTTPSHERVDLGLVQVPEGRGVFPYMSVRDNLLVGSYVKGARLRRKENLEFVLDFFPRLKERLKQLAGTLSGGEQQMLAVARALMSRPKLLMLDEPSLGLAPRLVTELFEKLVELNQRGLTVLLVEQNVDRCLELAQVAHVLENGRVVLSGAGKDLLEMEEVRRAYLGL